MNRTTDIERAAALATLLAYGSHLNLRPHTLIKDSEASERMIAMQQEYLGLMRRMWPMEKDRCKLSLEQCEATCEHPQDNYCPVHGRDIR